MRELVLLLFFVACEVANGQLLPPPTLIFHRCNWCGVGASCRLNRYCQCLTSNHVGNPHFLCVRPDLHDVCQVCDDPVLTTQNNDNVAVSYFNGTLLVDQQEEQRGQARVCRVRVFETRERVRGKSLPRCIRVRTDLTKSDGRPVCSFEFKIFGVSDENGNIQWKTETGQANPGGHDVVIQRNPWVTFVNRGGGFRKTTFRPRGCNCEVKFAVSVGNILTIRSTCCGQKFGFRPFVKKLDWLKAGFYMLSPRVSPQSLPPGDLPRTLPLCLKPGVSVRSVAERLGLKSRRHAMSFLALTNLPDNLVSESSARTAMKEALFRCTPEELQNLFEDTDFIINSAPFIREISGDMAGYETMMRIVRYAAEWFCDGNADSCRAILSAIEDDASGLVNNPTTYPKLAAFVARNCTGGSTANS
ncbi:hypothetical protein ElyMa_005669800 [Elysia marginata]|uniref:VWFD domain-containing protein n=1 Tax=Elysia marginata TaxID=1093978 RepID=A0AAV4FCQ3_9GAST|nr:hypothetical protein ElyMa_005669800 [Elysia marginata]